MSFIQNITKMKKRQLAVRLIEDAVVLYLMFACGWAICWLIGEILTKLGVN